MRLAAQLANTHLIKINAHCEFSLSMSSEEVGSWLGNLSADLAASLSAALMRPPREYIRHYQRLRRAARACALWVAYIEVALR